MKTTMINRLSVLVVPAVMLAFTACGTRTETEKTTVIEREVETPAPAPEPEGGHMQRAGEKMDAKVDREIDEAIDSMGE